MKQLLACIALIVLLTACAPVQITPGPKVEGKPVDIVKMYYAAWGSKDYAKMYGLVSDGWKALEPTAHTEQDFAANMAGFWKKADGIRATFASEQSNDGKEAVVSVALEITTLDGRYINTNQTLTLAMKGNGWKLVHPYGEHKDDS